MLFVPEILHAPKHLDAYDAVKQMIAAQGNYKCCGSGAFGRAYSSPDSDIIYKTGNAKHNNGYLSYLKTIAMSGSLNRFLPKIYGVRFIYDTHGNCQFVVAMEKLKEAHKVLSYDVGDSKEKEIYRKLKNAVEYNKKVGVPELEEVKDIIKEALRMCKDNCIDMHEGNVMLRENGDLVITDPIA